MQQINGPKVWHSNDAYRKVIWQCNHKFDGQKCTTPTLTEDEIKELFLRAANQVIDQKEQFIAIYEQVLAKSLDTTALESELSELETEINIAAMKELRSREPLTEFRETDWLAMVDYITVHSKKDIRVTFKDGTEIKA